MKVDDLAAKVSFGPGIQNKYHVFETDNAKHYKFLSLCCGLWHHIFLKLC
jgi:hypothetical protein